MTVKHERGYLIPAFNTRDVDYETCAETLKHSILSCHSDAHVTILTTEQLPYGDQGGQANDWQCFAASPYRETIKLEADMVAATGINHWWPLFEKRDVVISLGARDWYDNHSECRVYRKIFDANNLPDVYNAITYWRVSRTAQEFFGWVRRIFQEWTTFKTVVKFPDERPTTDIVYAMAAVIMGPESVTLPQGIGPTIVHMKPGIVPLRGRDWTQELIWETDPLRIQTVTQWGLVHYHVKSWAEEYRNERGSNH